MRLALHVLPSVLLLNFNPRIPYGMRLVSRIYIIKQDLFQSTHPVWDATRSPRVGVHLAFISIHASRMGCDVAHLVAFA